MAEQVFKKTAGGGNNDEESTFVVGEGNIEVPDIDGAMEQINKTLRKTEIESAEMKPIILEETVRRRSSCCWDGD